jgi:ketosteroid isomerase-like protein
MSTRMLIVVLPLLFACSRSTSSSSSGADPAGGEHDEAGRQAVSQLEDQWAKAIEAHDTTFLTRVLAPDFHGTSDSGKTFGRADVLRDAADTATQLRNVRDQDREVRIYGNGTVAVVTALGSWTVEKGQQPGQRSGRYTETWVKRDGGSQAVAGHYSDVPHPAPQP